MTNTPIPVTQLMLRAFPKAGFYPEYPQRLFDKIVDSINTVRETCGYEFVFPMPVKVMALDTVIVKKRKKYIFCGPESDEKFPYVNCYLVFDKQLTEQELTMWRMFKMGYYSWTGFAK